MVDGDEPFAEDRWSLLRIGGVGFRVAKPIGRCVMTTIDPASLVTAKEPIRTLQELGKKHGYTLTEIPVDAAAGQEQKSQWLQIRREKPDYVIMYGWGVMNQAAIQEAANVRYPMDQFIGIWWSGSEVDV